MWVVSKATIVMSNIPGPKKYLTYQGKKSRGIIGLIPGLGDLAFGISAVSHENKLYMSVQGDETYLRDPELLK